jgi:hypothetical protein
MRAVVLFALFTAGCASSATDPSPGDRGVLLPGADRVTFQAERSSYRHGDTAVIVLRNGLDEPLGYNLCFSSREVRVGDGWKRMSPLRACTAELRGLAPGAQTTLREPITGEWQPGEYRMVTSLERMRTGSRGEVFTPPFTVQR